MKSSPHCTLHSRPHPVEHMLGYSFQQVDVLHQALCHPSCQQGGDLPASYERLEFLGDAVLDLLASSLLLRQWPKASEGELSARRAQAVCQSSLSRLGQLWALPASIIMGPSMRQMHRTLPEGVVADVVEALAGAVFLDGGWLAAERTFSPWLEQVFNWQDQPQDHKSALQELCHRLQLEPPCYHLLESIGPDHRKTFVYQVSIGSATFGPCQAVSKRKAEQACACLALQDLGQQHGGLAPKQTFDRTSSEPSTSPSSLPPMAMDSRLSPPPVVQQPAAQEPLS